jgi:hypothetical protein
MQQHTPERTPTHRAQPSPAPEASLVEQASQGGLAAWQAQALACAITALIMIGFVLLLTTIAS